MPAKTLHAALLLHNWRTLLDASFGLLHAASALGNPEQAVQQIGLLHATSALGNPEQAVQQSSAAGRRPAEAAAHKAGLTLLRAYLLGPQGAAQTGGDPGEQLAGRHITEGLVRNFSAVERLQRLDLMVAPPNVAAVYAEAVAEAAAEDAGLRAWLIASLAESFDSIQ